MKFTDISLKTYAISLFLIATLVLAGCQAQQPSQELSDGTVTFSVGSQQVDCVGVGPQKCLIVNGENFYDTIQGFEYQEGYEYELLVKRIEREEPIPADASQFIYELKEVVSKNPVIPEGCISWFDGCNTCTINEDGTLGACTLKACFDTRPASCQTYEEEEMYDEYGDEIEEQDRFCCRALIASCLACDEGVSVAEYCDANPQTVGCE